MNSRPIDISSDKLAREITSLVTHIHAATARLLSLVYEFDKRNQAHELGMRSTAHWLHWQCGISLGAAREKVRTAAALAELPLINTAFHKGELSYSKVRALTRICTREKEAMFLNIGLCGSASQVERIVKKYRQIERTQSSSAAMHQYQSRELNTYWDDDGALIINGRLTAEQGVLFLKTLEAGVEQVNVEQSCPDEDVSMAAKRADALLMIAEIHLSNLGKSAVLSNTADRYQVVISVPAETLLEDTLSSTEPEKHPCFEPGPPIAVDTARRLTCDAALIPMLESAFGGNKGEPLNIGRKTRTIPPAIRRALHKRDGGCRFPGCTSGVRYTDAHHAKHWSDGGETSMENLVLVCRYHHRQLHEGGYRIAPAADGTFVFIKPNNETFPNVNDQLTGGNFKSLFDRNGEIFVEDPLSIQNISFPREKYVDYPYVMEILFQGE